MKLALMSAIGAKRTSLVTKAMPVSAGKADVLILLKLCSAPRAYSGWSEILALPLWLCEPCQRSEQPSGHLTRLFNNPLMGQREIEDHYPDRNIGVFLAELFRDPKFSGH